MAKASPASAKKAPAKKAAAKSKTVTGTSAREPAKKVSAVASDAAAASRAQASDAVDEQLARYRSMRDFGVTAEPAGKSAASNAKARPGLAFCIQKHAASHLHYDFRLEWNGVLKSWACAKGPSYNVKDKRLAIQVEDHPIEYGGFEGIIPAGQYGGGTVMLWDQGIWAPQAGYDDVDAGLRDGHLKFTLDGAKLHGKWALIRMKPRPKETKPTWLLIKEHDSFEREPADEAVTDAEQNSVITGRSLEEIAASKDHVWNSKETAAAQQNKGHAWHRIDVKPTPKAKPAPTTSPPAKLPARLAKAVDALPKEHQPTFVPPQLAQETQSPPDGSAWIHELKLDGYRMQARKDGAKVQMLTRSGLDWTARIPAVAAEITRLPIRSVTLDGEVVVLAQDGTTSFADLQASFQEGARNPLTYFCFDLLHIDGRNPRGLELLQRKELLTEVIAPVADAGILQVSEHLTAHGKQMFHKACEMHAEGIVSKRADSPYTAGRTAAWVKAKCLHEQEFVIGGYTLPGKGNAGGPGLGALLLGYYDDQDTLYYAGRTGTGFTQKSSAQIRRDLEKLSRSTSPFKSLTADARRGAIFVRPERVAQVRFATWTADQQVRQAAFLGMREDKPAGEVRRETAAPTPKSNQPQTRVASFKPGLQSLQTIAAPATAPAAFEFEKAPVRLTHPDKILDPTSGLTKQQLADFYWAVSERMLPYLAGRALSLVRLPNGVGKPAFYQKHVTSALPPGFSSISIADKAGNVEPYVTLSTREAIAALAQLSVLEVHPWGSRADDLERPDRLVIDLDPDEALPWDTLAGAARDIRKRLKQMGLESWVKTTGGKGLHVVLPIEPDLAWPAIKQLAHGFVTLAERSNPALYLTKMTKSARTGKIYLDYLRNERGATAVAAWSPRAREHVGVAVPLSWPELDQPTRPVFRIANFADWCSRLKKDPWKSLLTTRQSISKDAQKACGVKD